MFGTGEFASSSSESTIPSRTSSSWSVGTYWRQIGSPGDFRRQPAFRFSKQLRADARALAFTIHDDPVQIPGRCRAGCRAPACIADQVLTIEGADEAIVVGAALAQASIEQLDRGRDLF